MTSPLARDQSALLEPDALEAADVDDRSRSAATTIRQALIEGQLTAVIGAGLHERAETRTAQRNGSRRRTLTTTAGTRGLGIPERRAGSFFPSLPERRRRIDQALFAVAREASLHGVPDAEGRRPGEGCRGGYRHPHVRGVPVLRRSARRDRRLRRPLAGRAGGLSVFLDATYCKARVDRRVVSRTMVIATGAAADASSTSSPACSAASSRPQSHALPRRRGPGRGTRRVAGLRPPLPLRRLHASSTDPGRPSRWRSRP